MSDKAYKKLSNLYEAQMDLSEAQTLIEISHTQFQDKLSLIEKQFVKASAQEQYLLRLEAQNLYREYKRSLEVIENYADQIMVRNALQSL